MRTRFSSIPALTVAFALAACGGLQNPSNNGKNNAANNDTGDYTPPADYPAGPYGVQQDSIIADIGFNGVDNPNKFLSGHSASDINSALTTVHLSAFRHKTPVLLLTASAGWCEYCNMEEADIVSFYNQLNGIDPGSNTYPEPTQLGILEALVNDNNSGEAAPTSFIATWSDGNPMWWGSAHAPYAVTFDLVLDPNGAVLSPYYQEAAFPVHIIITTADMKIRYEFVGQNDTSLRNTVNALLQCATVDDASGCN